MSTGLFDLFGGTDGLTDVVKEGGDQAREVVREGGGQARGLFGDVGEFIDDRWEDVKDVVRAPFEGVKGIFDSAGKGATDTAQEVRLGVETLAWAIVAVTALALLALLWVF